MDRHMISKINYINNNSPQDLTMNDINLKSINSKSIDNYINIK